jgi:hypothetical protein
VSATAPAPAGGAGGLVPTTPLIGYPLAAETCPLCGQPLEPDQDWCLRCGGAARTRLASPPRWRGPVIAVAVVIALALGVLAAALVSLAGSSQTRLPPLTTTVAVPGVTPVPVLPPTTTAAPGATGASGAATGATGTSAGATGTSAGPTGTSAGPTGASAGATGASAAPK